MTANTAEMQALVDRANSGDQEAWEQILGWGKELGRVAPTWRECSRSPAGHLVGRNQLPATLWDAFSAGVLVDPSEVARGLADAWVMAEFPSGTVDEPLWLEMFQHTGFITDDGPSDDWPAPHVLYRSAHPDYLRGMSWTDHLPTAAFFAKRNRDFGFLTEADPAVIKVHPERHPHWKPLAAFRDRGEHEWVMPTDDDVAWEPISFDELEALSRTWKPEGAPDE